MTATSQNTPLKRKKLSVFPAEKLTHRALKITVIFISLTGIYMEVGSQLLEVGNQIKVSMQMAQVQRLKLWHLKFIEFNYKLFLYIVIII